MNTIYKATNKITGKSYIGFDSAWPNRKERHQENAAYKREGKFYDSIRKHGWESFEWSVIYQSKDKHHTLNIIHYETLRKGREFLYILSVNHAPLSDTLRPSILYLGTSCHSSFSL